MDCGTKISGQILEREDLATLFMAIEVIDRI